jgi:hypothetical protein
VFNVSFTLNLLFLRTFRSGYYIGYTVLVSNDGVNWRSSLLYSFYIPDISGTHDIYGGYTRSAFNYTAVASTTQVLTASYTLTAATSD